MNLAGSSSAKTVRRLVLTALKACDGTAKYPAQLAPELWGLETDAAGRLHWDGCHLDQLAREFGTPLHVVSRARLEANYRQFHAVFAARWPRVAVAYSYKTNPLPGVLRALHDCGADAEVISHFELWLALQLGVPPERIVFNGPAKTPAALELAVRHGIKLINIDGEGEIAQIEACAARHGRRQAVGLRVLASVGWAGQFGFTMADGAAQAVFRRIGQCGHLDPCALHLHLGTDIHAPQLYFVASRELFTFARRLQVELGMHIRHFDLGGGFGVPTVRPITSLEQRFLEQGYAVRPPQPDALPRPEDYAAGIVPLAREYLAAVGGKPPELMFEPGRALSSSAQCLLLGVLSAKRGEGRARYLIADGGRNLTLPMNYEYHELFPANRMHEPRLRHTVCGPLCHPSDIVVAQRELPPLVAGDVLAVMDAGAYFIPNQMNFSNPRPAVVMIVDGAAQLIRERETFQDLLRQDELAG